MGDSDIGVSKALRQDLNSASYSLHTPVDITYTALLTSYLHCHQSKDSEMFDHRSSILQTFIGR
jgi:hypothetical protein